MFNGFHLRSSALARSKRTCTKWRELPAKPKQKRQVLQPAAKILNATGMALDQNLRYFLRNDYHPTVVCFKPCRDVHRGARVLAHGQIVTRRNLQSTKPSCKDGKRQLGRTDEGMSTEDGFREFVSMWRPRLYRASMSNGEILQLNTFVKTSRLHEKKGKSYLRQDCKECMDWSPRLMYILFAPRIYKSNVGCHRNLEHFWTRRFGPWVCM